MLLSHCAKIGVFLPHRRRETCIGARLRRDVPARANSSRPDTERRLPSLFRFLFITAILAGLAWGGMLALVAFVEPTQREMTQTVPASKFGK